MNNTDDNNNTNRTDGSQSSPVPGACCAFYTFLSFPFIVVFIKSTGVALADRIVLVPSADACVTRSVCRAVCPPPTRCLGVQRVQSLSQATQPDATQVTGPGVLVSNSIAAAPPPYEVRSPARDPPGVTQAPRDRNRGSPLGSFLFSLF